MSKVLHELYDFNEKSKYDSFSKLLHGLHLVFKEKLETINKFNSNLIDLELLDEIRSIVLNRDIPIYFGNTLRDIKIVISDGCRTHEVFVEYIDKGKLVIASASIPTEPFIVRQFESLEAIITAIHAFITDLSIYFNELELIDQHCMIVEPVKPTFKDQYRKIVIDGRTWLHVEVRYDGIAQNVHLVGQHYKCHEKLQKGLLNWDNDKNIFENIMMIFDIVNFPSPPKEMLNFDVEDKITDVDAEEEVQTFVCGICLSGEIPCLGSVPQPLCQNPICTAYFHRICLFQWLTACVGGRPPAFGVATGECPSCFQTIACNENDD